MCVLKGRVFDSIMVFGMLELDSTKEETSTAVLEHLVQNSFENVQVMTRP